jgi:Cd2+/Zn2+-exporting ATPase
MSSVTAPTAAPELAQPGRGGLAHTVFSTRGELIAAITAGALLGLGFALGFAVEAPWVRGFAWASLAIGFLYGGRAALDAVREGKVDIDVLMIVGAGLAAWAGAPGEGALLLFLFVLAGALEDMAAQRTRREVEALHALMPTEADVLRDGAWVRADPMTLVTGDTIKVKPGQRIPADAVITVGETEIDQSAMTGESVTRHVAPGDEVFSGTINADDPVEARVIRPAAQSSLQKVLSLVMTAREQREPVQRIIDRLSGPYATGVLVTSVVVLLVWRFALGFAWDDAVYIAITFLIICSPCALVIATPTATLAGIARAAKVGVLFKGGQSTERLAAVRAVCFDKTGTLTIGRPRVQQVQPVAWSAERGLLAIAAALEADSTHPIATAIREAASGRGVEPAGLEKVGHTTGRGMSGVLATPSGPVEVRLGSYRHVEEVIPRCLRAHTRAVLDTIQKQGRIGVVVARGQAQGESPDAAGEAMVITMADAVRPGAEVLVRELHALGVRPVRMLTGDNQTTAKAVADALGLDAFDAELLPADKLRIVGEMKQAIHGQPRRFMEGPPGVAVIGDGVNDAPALAAADVSLAIGSIGSDAALESADIVLLSDDLSVVPWAVALARKIRRTIRNNLLFALGVIAVGSLTTLISSVLGHRIPMSVGVLSHEGGTILVVANSLRLLLVPGPARIGRVD